MKKKRIKEIKIDFRQTNLKDEVIIFAPANMTEKQFYTMIDTRRMPKEQLEQTISKL